MLPFCQYIFTFYPLANITTEQLAGIASGHLPGHGIPFTDNAGVVSDFPEPEEIQYYPNKPPVAADEPAPKAEEPGTGEKLDNKPKKDMDDSPFVSRQPAYFSSGQTDHALEISDDRNEASSSTARRYHLLDDATLASPNATNSQESSLATPHTAASYLRRRFQSIRSDSPESSVPSSPGLSTLGDSLASESIVAGGAVGHHSLWNVFNDEISATYIEPTDTIKVERVSSFFSVPVELEKVSEQNERACALQIQPDRAFSSRCFISDTLFALTLLCIRLPLCQLE